MACSDKKRGPMRALTRMNKLTIADKALPALDIDSTVTDQ